MGPSFNFEKQFRELGFAIIAGVDEVGRGAIAGPIVAGAVVFSDYSKITPKIRQINDSKVLTYQQREDLSFYIQKKADDFSFGEVSVLEINQMGIGPANILAFKRALDGLKNCDFALIDGRRFRGFDRKFFCLEKGESKSISIAAASIVAKVYRDHLMEKLGETMPDYLFGSNKGYGGKAHYEAIKRLGPSDHHRKDFIKWFYSSQLDIKF